MKTINRSFLLKQKLGTEKYYKNIKSTLLHYSDVVLTWKGAVNLIWDNS